MEVPLAFKGDFFGLSGLCSEFRPSELVVSEPVLSGVFFGDILLTPELAEAPEVLEDSSVSGTPEVWGVDEVLGADEVSAVS